MASTFSLNVFFATLAVCISTASLSLLIPRFLAKADKTDPQEEEKNRSMESISLLLCALLASTGLLYLALSGLGFHAPAIISVQVLSFLGGLVGCAVIVRVRLRRILFVLVPAMETMFLVMFAFSVNLEKTSGKTLADTNSHSSVQETSAPPTVTTPKISPLSVPISPPTAPNSLFLDETRTFLWAGVSFLLSLGTVLSIGLFLDAIRKGDSLQIETHWGGLGGGIGGWRVSASMAYLMMAALVGTLFVAALAETPKINAPEGSSTTVKQESVTHPSPSQPPSPSPEKKPAEESPGN